MKRPLLLVIAALAANLAPAGAAELSDSQIKDAQKLHRVKCAKCHELHDPAGYAKADWDAWMQKMKTKSKLNDRQFDLLTRYLEAFRTAKVPPVTSKK